jgi:hypothetical protein
MRNGRSESPGSPVEASGVLLIRAGDVFELVVRRKAPVTVPAFRILLSS